MRPLSPAAVMIEGERGEEAEQDGDLPRRGQRLAADVVQRPHVRDRGLGIGAAAGRAHRLRGAGRIVEGPHEQRVRVSGELAEGEVHGVGVFLGPAPAGARRPPRPTMVRQVLPPSPEMRRPTGSSSLPVPPGQALVDDDDAPSPPLRSRSSKARPRSTGTPRVSKYSGLTPMNVPLGARPCRRPAPRS